MKNNFLIQLKIVTLILFSPVVFSNPELRPSGGIPYPIRGLSVSVSGALEQGATCGVLDDFNGAIVTLKEFWYMNDGNGLTIPWSWRPDLGSYGYTRLVFSDGRSLEQEKILGNDTVGVDSKFKISFKGEGLTTQLAREINTPWKHNVYLISPDTIDQTDPNGYKKTTVYRVLKLHLSFNRNGFWGVIDQKSEPWVMFYGREQEKNLGNVLTTCFRPSYSIRAKELIDGKKRKLK